MIFHCFVQFQGEGDCTLVGNDIANIEALRSVVRNQFDRNVVVNFSNQVRKIYNSILNTIYLLL